MHSSSFAEQSLVCKDTSSINEHEIGDSQQGVTPPERQECPEVHCGCSGEAAKLASTNRPAKRAAHAANCSTTTCQASAHHSFLYTNGRKKLIPTANSPPSSSYFEEPPPLGGHR
jgi:hypothetical protein